jgi:hypothetical protein
VCSSTMERILNCLLAMVGSNWKSIAHTSELNPRSWSSNQEPGIG